MKRNQGLQTPPPRTIEELNERLQQIAGVTLAELAKQAQVPLPISPLHGKGFQGELIERFLGASAPGLPIPDFPELDIELKTVPVDEKYRPLESTFICYAPLNDIKARQFENSILFHKISRVLFVFVVAPRHFNYEERYVAGFRYWSPSLEEAKLIREDFEELYEMVATGHVDDITARMGTVIQMRPKAADGKALTDCPGPDGAVIKVRPRGFYMRRSFMEGLLQKFLTE